MEHIEFSLQLKIASISENKQTERFWIKPLQTKSVINSFQKIYK